MKRFILTASAGLLATLLALPSFAADLPRKAAPYYVAPFSWSGFYVGINGGYGWGKADLSNTFGTGSVSPTGGLAGVTIGYNMQTGAMVYGLEGDLDASWIKGTDSTAGTICAGGIGCEVRNIWLATARGRIGYAWDRWLPFITGGVAFGDVKLTTPFNTSSNPTKFGWTLGGGVEYAFMGPWSAKIEYLYADLGKNTCGAATCGVDTDFKFRTSIGRVGLNYRF